ncbi:MAG: LysM domain-containing protein [Desulfuromonadales bacterium]
MMMKKVVLLLCLGLIPFAAPAQDNSTTYIIKKGDTLWGISERFLKDTGFWPSLWSHNQQITNPHFIYPGQEIQIYGNRLRILPGGAEVVEAPVAVVEPPVAAPEPQEEIVIRLPGRTISFVATEELDDSGVLVDSDDSRILLTTGDKVFIEMKNLAESRTGDRFTLFTVRQEVADPRTGNKVGVLVTDLGTLEITEINQAVATAVIKSADMEITRGARLRPWQPALREVSLKRAEQSLTGVILTGGVGQLALGQYDIFYFDLGANRGIKPGNMLYISRPRTATKLALQDKDLLLPDVLLGSAVVLETRPQTATALILKMANQPIYRGDQVTTATE